MPITEPRGPFASARRRRSVACRQAGGLMLGTDEGPGIDLSIYLNHHISKEIERLWLGWFGLGRLGAMRCNPHPKLFSFSFASPQPGEFLSRGPYSYLPVQPCYLGSSFSIISPPSEMVDDIMSQISGAVISSTTARTSLDNYFRIRPLSPGFLLHVL